MTCEQQPKCDKNAVARIFWPGRAPIRVCLEHAAWAQRVADAMGFYLCVGPIPDEVPATQEDPTP